MHGAAKIYYAFDQNEEGTVWPKIERRKLSLSIHSYSWP